MIAFSFILLTPIQFLGWTAGKVWGALADGWNEALGK